MPDSNVDRITSRRGGFSSFPTKCGATFFFTGLFPVAPATVASFVTLALWWLLPPVSTQATILLLVAVAVIGTVAAGRAEPIYGHDAKPIVIDEVLGALVTVAFLGHGLRLMVVGFLVFRALDVIKPPPADRFESLPGGLGVMADDLMAGIYGNLLLWIVHLAWPTLL